MVCESNRIQHAWHLNQFETARNLGRLTRDRFLKGFNRNAHFSPYSKLGGLE